MLPSVSSVRLGDAVDLIGCHHRTTAGDVLHDDLRISRNNLAHTLRDQAAPKVVAAAG